MEVNPEGRPGIWSRDQCVEKSGWDISAFYERDEFDKSDFVYLSVAGSYVARFCKKINRI